MNKIQGWLSEHDSYLVAAISLGLAIYYGALFYAFFVFKSVNTFRDFVTSPEGSVINAGVGVFLFAFPYLIGPFIIPNCKSTDWYSMSILLTLSLWFASVFSLVCVDLFIGKELFHSKYLYILTVSAMIVGFVFWIKRGNKK